MTRFYEILRHQKVERTNYVILMLYIAVSITCHSIANRLILINHYALFSSALLYMSVFVLTDVLATYNSRSLVIIFIFLDAIANLLFMAFTNYVNTLPYPDFFTKAEAYKIVFNPVADLYFANLIGTLIAAIIDLFLFYYLYKKLRLNFLLSSVLSSGITISCYTLVTDIIAFKESFPHHYLDLTLVNIISNLLTILIYALIAQLIVCGIKKYITN